MTLAIHSDGPLIVATNFWETEFEQKSLVYLSLNARAFRLLLPRQWEEVLSEMATGKIVRVRRAKSPGKYALELMFDDSTENPYCLHLSDGQIDRLPAKEDDGRTDLEFTAWTQPRRGVPHEALRRPAIYQIVPKLLR